MATANIIQTYSTLRDSFGPQYWWPVTPETSNKPKYSGGPKSAKQQWEVVVGAILAQSTAWGNAEKAIVRLNEEKLNTPKKIASASLFKLQTAIRPSGYFRQKARYLKNTAQYVQHQYQGDLARMFSQATGALRQELLSLQGIGPETADSILLYAAGKPKFVVDVYTRRIVHRLGWLENPTYEQTQIFFENNLPKNVKLFQEYHALFVELAKRNCFKTKPACTKRCPMRKMCPKKGV